LSRVLGWGPVRWVGTRSYGLYLYHWPIFQIVRKQAAIPLQPLTFVLCLIATAAITELSYRFVEMPIRQGRLGEWLHGERRARTAKVRRQRRRMAVLAALSAATVSFATVSIGLADQQCVTRQECDSAQAAQALENAPKNMPTLPPPPATTTSTTTSTTTAPTESSAPVDPAATTLPADPTATTVAAVEPPATTTTDAIIAPTGVPVLAIGESVMLGALPQLQAGGITVDAQISRQGLTTAELLEGLAGFGQIPPIVVIQTGTNGSVSTATFARIMAQLPPDRVPLVVFLTVKAPKGWIADNNAKIRALPTLYPNVRVIDWEAAAAVIGGELSSSDGGVHLATVNAKQFYANLVFDGIGRPDLKR
ncbi:MAG TPA: acyltransferase family protein, partial [Ilumatobacteraceae bacterium]|nr:acyltransferase family protein [Ilumatobacteraceae bacterium]